MMQSNQLKFDGLDYEKYRDMEDELTQADIVSFIISRAKQCKKSLTETVIINY